MFYDQGADLRAGHIGIRYWFENDAGEAFTESGVAPGGNYTLHIRGNTGAYISIWDVERGIELMSRGALSGGILLNSGQELAVPDIFEFAADAPARRIIIVWGRSQSEQAGSVAGAEARLRELTPRMGRDGALQIVRESDDVTPGQTGTYVINREGMPLATEIVLRSP